MTCKIFKTIDDFSMLEKGDRVAVGFSGGADSVCLLHFLSKLRDKGYIYLKAVHVNHNIRGEEALRDENFVREFCRKYNIELSVFSVDIPQKSKEMKVSLEECGRIVRYQCFNSVDCNKIAVAHTLSDSIETIIFNLARGTGLKGASGIAPVRDNIIRPLIDCSRQDIESYCKENSLSYVTDSSNLSNDYSRNTIRHNVIPVLKSINSSFEENFLRFSRSVYDDENYLEICADELIKSSYVEGKYKLQDLEKTHVAVLRRVIAKIISSCLNKPVEKKHIELCIELVKNGYGTVELSKKAVFSVKDGFAFVSASEKRPISTEWKIPVENEITVTPGGDFIIKQSPFNEFSGEKINSFDFDEANGNLFFRSRGEKDKISLLKRNCSKSLKKLFNESKIPAEKRSFIAVLSDSENNVIWVDGFGVDSRFAVTEKTKTVCEIIKIKRKDNSD
ncbi:MAG: tRNA lysidine(34) synthetase TilS [Clostridia bacterium]|nr:tRNA lysidine(34) synthetase TilS [Clostridia bacterium]